MMNWDDVRYLLAVEREGSLAAAARKLKVDETTVSRRLRALERALGARLFERVEGRWSATPSGEAALALGRRIEEEMIALAHSVDDRAVDVAGLVRVTALEALLSGYLVRHAADLRAAHPRLLLEFIGGHRNLSLSRREADIAVRLARPQAGSLVIRELADCGFGVYGARSAAATFNAGASADRNWVAYDDTLHHLPEMRWLLEKAPLERLVLRSNSLSALVEAVARGVGLGVLPCFLADARNDLVRLSGPTPEVSREFWLLVHEELRSSARIRAVADWLVARFDADAPRFAGIGTGTARAK
jgi:DNA-binding transcriptional LysR family regulator